MAPFIGQIKLFAGDFAPKGWALCEGQLLKINDYKDLYKLVGTDYGGNGRETFGLPDFRGRAAISAGAGAGLTPKVLGQKGGAPDSYLTIANLASHNHVVTGEVKVGVNEEDPNTEEANGSTLGNTPSGNIIYNSTAVGPNEKLAGVSHKLATSLAGSNQQINNMGPFQAVNFIIAIEGTIPS